MKKGKINAKIQDTKSGGSIAKENWEAPEVSVILVNETLADLNRSSFDNLGFS